LEQRSLTDLPFAGQARGGIIDGMKPILLVRLLVALAFCGPTASGARDWQVSGSGGGDFVSIQAAIDAASDGDRVLIAPGAYVGALDMRGKQIDLIGPEGPGLAVVDAGGVGSALRVPFGPAGPFHVRRLIFTGGIGTLLRDGRYGGGALIELASPVFEDCAFVGNIANSGGGVYVISGLPQFVRCRFASNGAGAGGGICVEHDGGTLLDDCVIQSNSAVYGGGCDLFRARVAIHGGSIRNNTAVDGGGLRVREVGETPVFIGGALVTGNESSRGGGIYAEDARLLLDQTTIAGNASDPSGASLEIRGGDGTITETLCALDSSGWTLRCEGFGGSVSCSILFGPRDPVCGDEDRVWDVDPLLCDPEAGDYHPRPDSPCLPGQGPDACSRIGALDVGCEVPVPVRPLHWGEVRALFR
jgi:hypothetical protein